MRGPRGGTGRGGIGGLEGLYRKVTADRPDDARTCNVKSVLALENGRVAEAAELIGRAVALAPAEHTYLDRKSTRLNSSDSCAARMPSSACKKKPTQHDRHPTTPSAET